MILYGGRDTHRVANRSQLVIDIRGIQRYEIDTAKWMGTSFRYGEMQEKKEI